ncbi:MAG: DUF5110 domain-containing protein [Bacteroidaceae bacterium]|nr:DUF5110 domain-containing protein [Bacteroidaceae bacterium]
MMKKFAPLLFILTFSLASYGYNLVGTYTADHRGVILPTNDGGKLCVQMIRPDIVRVRYTASGELDDTDRTGVCVKRTEKSRFPVHIVPDRLRWLLVSDSLFVEIPWDGDAIIFRDRRTNKILGQEMNTRPREGKRIVEENIVYDESSRRMVQTADGEKEVRDILRRDTVGTTWQYTLNWQLSNDEAIYGLGSHMEDYMDLRDKKIYLSQHNLKAVIPVISSTAGYGILIDAGSEMIYDRGRIDIGAAKQLDYYFMKGATMDNTISAYRWLTGKSPMMPRYLFGYTQSKERYHSSEELLQILGRFRREHIPIDMIVQDWNYWQPSGWGHMWMNPTDYPDKRALTDSIHAQHARLMVSIWPTFSDSPQVDDFARRGFFLPGTNAYDVFNPAARDLYWEYARKEFFDNGFDAWWCDSSEPLDADWGNRGETYGADSHEERWELSKDKLSGSLGHERNQLYSLHHAQGIYEHQRAASKAKRVVNLTRSSYAGQQRYATITWNGDTYASWKSFRQMIPAGLNFMATGCPYWSVDVGAFFVKKGWAWFYNGDYEQGVADMGYRELYVRMLQYATFLPVMRSHGTDTPREPWRFGNPGEPFYESVLHSIRLRYALLPYTYSLAWRVSNDDYTLTRALAFDFPRDKRVYDIKDEFLFGPSLLVAPVTTPMYFTANSTPVEQTDKTRKVYLPQSRWYDFYTGQQYQGGQEVTASAPIDRIPLFVREGSILPLTDSPIEWTDAVDTATIALRIYPGKDAEFTLYEDSGDGYQCEDGDYATINLYWYDRRRTLFIEQRKGHYTPKLPTRHFRIQLMDTNEERTIVYDGKAIKVCIK